jgi:hypothetical protein
VPVQSQESERSCICVRHIARQNFIFNDPFSGGQSPGEILIFTSQTFSMSVAMTSYKHKRTWINFEGLFVVFIQIQKHMS